MTRTYIFLFGSVIILTIAGISLANKMYLTKQKDIQEKNKSQISYKIDRHQDSLFILKNKSVLYDMISYEINEREYYIIDETGGGLGKFQVRLLDTSTNEVIQNTFYSSYKLVIDPNISKPKISGIVKDEDGAFKLLQSQYDYKTNPGIKIYFNRPSLEIYFSKK
jgi:hypothetical protein